MSAVAFPAPAVHGPARRRALPVVAPPRAEQFPCPPALRRAHRTTARVRLTDRGRGVLATLALLGALLGGAGVGMMTAGHGSAVPADSQQVTVVPGQTLWGIASEVADETQDVRVVMDTIRSMNSLASDTVHPGQELAVPAAD